MKGLIEWPTLGNVVTKFLGKKVDEKTVKFREYMVAEGDEENIQIPNNYTLTLKEGKMEGKIHDSSQQVNVLLTFTGIVSSNEGLCLFINDGKGFGSSAYKSVDNKRKFEEFSIDNNAPTLEKHRVMAFKKLTQNSQYWFDRKAAIGKTVKRTKSELEEPPRKSCGCGLPLFETPVGLKGEKKLVCSKYPNCKQSEFGWGSFTIYYDEEDDD